MYTKRKIKETGSVLVCALGAILILSIIGAGVLYNCTTRLNVSETQVRGWKDALAAAESGGDIAFAELRNTIPTMSPAPSASSWTSSSWSPAPSPTPTHVSNVINITTNLQTQTKVEACYFDSSGAFHLGESPSGHMYSWYRVRSKGTALLPGLKRTGMDDALLNDAQQHFAAFGTSGITDITARGKGDSLLRKIDFKYDHFTAAYGPSGDGTGKALVSVSTPQVSRRIEQMVAPVTDSLFKAAITTTGSFYGLGSAGYLDSFDSNSATHPQFYPIDDPHTDPDSRHGDVQVGDASVTLKSPVYGNLSTDGADISGTTNVTGTIDNNVPLEIPDYSMPDTTAWQYQAPGSGPGQLPPSITSNQSLTPPITGTADNPTYYVISSLSGNLTVNPNSVRNADGTYSPVDTYVAIRVNGGNITGGIVVNPKVHMKIYFDGNIDTKNENLVNNSPSSTNPNAANLQFYGISPPRDANGDPIRTQTIELDSGGGNNNVLLAATFYAPSADFSENGHPDFIGAIVAKTFYANGNVAWHYDLQLGNIPGNIVDYRVASYVEDAR